MSLHHSTAITVCAQYYAAKAYSSQADVGDQYHDLKALSLLPLPILSYFLIS
ncbi:hypothetical protein [Wolbachia endosymbiont (group B) of Longitarsus flavicornis]|uniref:hypothetical protein n=1 Tax=Wolbachia endosymbiont (group B) of Longitarsus flavicornis TaxID=3066135 RepID=UPI00397D3078